MADEGLRKLIEQQKSLQSQKGTLVHLKANSRVTSVLIPLALAGVGTFFVAKALTQLVTGYGKGDI
eukprot:jgi/Chlat1/8893/Chrsp92S08232